MEVIPAEKIAAIILAAGASQRLGRPKQLLQIGGHSLVRRAALAAVDAGCSPIIVVSGFKSDPIISELNDLPIRPIYNANWTAGIGTSLRTGVQTLHAERAPLAGSVVIVCDQPYLNGAILKNLIGVWRKSGKSMAACSYSGTFGTPCCFARSKFPDMLAIADDSGAKGVLWADQADLALFPWPQGSIDLDRPEDLAKLDSEKKFAKML